MHLRTTIPLIIVLVFIPYHASGQILENDLVATQRDNAYWEVRAISDFIQNKSHNEWYPTSTLALIHANRHFQLGMNVFVNQIQNFEFAPERLIIVVDDVSIDFPDSTRFRARSDLYDIQETFSTFLKFRQERFSVVSWFAALTQQSDVEVPLPEQVNDSFFVINWEPVTQKKTSLIASLIGSFSLGKMGFTGGLLNLPVKHFGNVASKYSLDLKPTPYSGVRWQNHHSWVMASTDTKLWSLGFARAFDGNSISPQRTVASLTFESGIRGYSFNSLEAKLSIPFSNKVRAYAAYKNVWSKSGAWSRAHFQNWQRATTLGSLFPLNNILPQSSFQAGITLTLENVKKTWPIKILDFQLQQPHIFSAQSDFYTQSPIAILELLNESPEPVLVDLSLETSDKTGIYRASTFKLASGTSKRLPLYLFLKEGKVHAQQKSEQLIISGTVNNQTKILASHAISIYGMNAWNGNTWGLKYFLDPEAPAVVQRTRKISQSLPPKNETTAPVLSEFQRLKIVIDAFGKELHYLPDPANAYGVDQVQLPAQTIAKGGGDCEDLTVCLASGLMALGIHSAVVDIRPKNQDSIIATAKPGNIGHVFLLVDTGIDVRHSNELGLNEFQGISRMNVKGKRTLWLPIETSFLSQGFETAFDEGVRQYYHEIIEKQGMVKGNVHVYDF